MSLAAVTFALLISMVSIEAKLAPTIRLSSGYSVPIIGIGSFEIPKNDTERVIKDAIDVGYRHIDTAFVYENEVEIGNAVRAKIEEGVIKREDIFITTKLWDTFHDTSMVEKAFRRSFDNLNLDYIDLYLLHGPQSYRRVLKNASLPADDVDSYEFYVLDKDGEIETNDIDYLDAWRAMEKLVESGRVRSIGISNFNSEQTDRVLSVAKLAPVTNQVECHPNLNQRKLIEFSKERNITITAYSPLGRNGKNLAINDQRVLNLAQKHGKSPAQILLRYAVQNGAIVIPKSTKKKHIEDNFNIFDFELSDSDMEFMHSLNNNHRLFDGVKGGKYYQFNIEF